jgi:hypothetical protein
VEWEKWQNRENENKQTKNSAGKKKWKQNKGTKILNLPSLME